MSIGIGRRRGAASKAAVLALVLSGARAQAPAGADILRRVDENIGSGAKVVVSEMIIHGRRASRSIKARSWIRGVIESFTEYLEPAREKGTKMLKLGDELWTYTPATDRIIRISGHLLRQSVMGSDLSYEDMMEDPVLANVYEAAVAGEEALLERPCWVLELTAKKDDTAYFRRKTWVDRERYVILREELYARSGKLLKTLEVRSVRQLGRRWVQDRTIYRDAMKRGAGTEFIVESMELDAVIPDHVFSKASLRR